MMDMNNPFSNVHITVDKESIVSFEVDGKDIASAVKHFSLNAGYDRRTVLAVEVEPETLRIDGDPCISRLYSNVVTPTVKETIFSKIRRMWRSTTRRL